MEFATLWQTTFLPKFFFLDACIGDFGSQPKGKIAWSEEDSLRSARPRRLRRLGLAPLHSKKLFLRVIILFLPCCCARHHAAVNVEPGVSLDAACFSTL